MFNKRSLFVPAALIVASFLGGPAADAQAQQCYNLASLQGTYALVGNYGANVAIALGTRTFDGNGNLAGTAIVNEPTAGSTTGARTLVVASQTGTYTVNCNGTGQFNRVVTTNTGVTAMQVDDFIVTAAIVQNGNLLATTIVDAQEVPSAIVAGGIFLNRTYTLRPTGCYTQASLQGSYAIIGNYGANVATALGIRYLDGNGNLTGTAIVNEPTAGSTTGARTLVTATQAGTYTVNCDGTGQFNRLVTTNTGVAATQVDDFVVTGAIVQNGNLLATNIVDAQEVPSAIVAGGIFLNRTYTLRPTLQTAAPPTGGGSSGVTIVVTGPGGATSPTNTFGTVSSLIVLDASQSTSTNVGTLTYSWTASSGFPPVSMTGANTATPTLQLAFKVTYQLTLTVTDAKGVAATATVTVQYI
jgi:predicted small secreted protein